MGYPEPPARFDPLFEPWPAGTLIWRCHQVRRGPLEFNPTASEGRFRPIRDAAGAVVPTAYGAGSEHAAIAEGPFHDLPVSAAPKHLPQAVADRRALSPLEPRRDLRLVSLRGHGLRRLGETQGSLVEPGPGCYAASAAWGQAAYAHADRPDGMVWVSRQFPGGAAVFLFCDRCGPDLAVAGPTMPLAFGAGFELLCEAAVAAGVAIVAG